MAAGMGRTVRDAVINGAAFVLIRFAGVVYVSVMTLLAAWSIIHSLLLPPPVYA